MKGLILIALLISNAFANGRVDNIINEDANARLTRIEVTQVNLSNAKKDLDSFEKSLLPASKTENRERVFVTIRNTAGIAAAISFALTGTFFYKARVAKSEGGLYNLLLAYGGVTVTGATALVAAGGEVGVYFSKNEAESLREKVKELQNVLILNQNELKTEVKLLCKDDPRHKLCY